MVEISFYPKPWKYKMSYIKINLPDDAAALDINGMGELTTEEYARYLEYELFSTDHHDVLRCNFGEFPIAVTKDQYQALIKYLQGKIENHYQV